MREHGGVLTTDDFARYRIRIRTPVRTTYRSYEIVGFPPPSSGGVHVAQILNLLEGFDLAALGAGSADFLHVTAEAMKRAFADRAYWLGDPDFTRVPPGLVRKDYAQRLARDIRLDAATPVPGHGSPDAAVDLRTDGQTTHFSTADAAGNWVACTATINTYFGAKAVVPGTGILLNNEMDDFSAQPGATNYFGLVGAQANAVAPGKRPLSSMSPTIVLQNGRPILAVGASGGPTIISQTLLVLLNTLDFKLDLAAALGQPRFHHQWRPDELRVEPGVSADVRRELERRGHWVVETRVLAATQAVARPPGSGEFVGVGEPRAGAAAAAW
jgi:gamma-glutamyltranspeptidase/glutathione hydrolase